MQQNQHPLEDEQLIIRRSQEDISYFRPLYEAYHHRILNYIFHKVQDKEIAQDLCSQVFMSAMRNIKKYEIRYVSFGAWLYKIAFNETMGYFRKSKKIQSVTIDDEVLEGLGEELEEQDHESVFRLLEAMLGSLQKEDIELIELRFYEHKTFKEIAHILNCSESAAKVRSQRLIGRLREALKEKIKA